MKIDTFKTFLDDQSKSDKFSGAVLIMQDGKKLIEYASGFANKEKHISNKIDTIFNLGSINKMFTAVAICQLVEKKKISFEDKVGKYLSYFPKEIGNTMTVHQILTHTEGFSSYFNDTYINKLARLTSVDDYINLFKDLPPQFSPGEKYQYSNSGYIVLGAIIEKITGQSYYDYVTEYIFNPSGMSDTGSYNPHLENRPIAHGYTHRLPHSSELATGPLRDATEELPPIGNPAGGGYSTCADLYKFSNALLGNKLLSPDMTALMLSPKVFIEEKNGQKLHYGYGMQILDMGKDHFRYGHGGTFAGVSARFAIYPWMKTTIVVLSNYDPPSAFTVANKCEELIMD